MLRSRWESPDTIVPNSKKVTCHAELAGRGFRSPTLAFLGLPVSSGENFVASLALRRCVLGLERRPADK